MKFLSRQTAAAFLAAGLMAAATPAFAQQTYEGDIVGVNGAANTFTVHGTRAGGVPDMAFHVEPATQIVIDGERRILAELVKGDHVIVTYSSSGGTHTVQRAERTTSGQREMTFSGQVVSLDFKTNAFTVKHTAGTKVEEMKFHLSPQSRVYVGGEEEHLLAQLKVGDTVTVGYEPSGPVPHDTKHVRKG